MRIGQENPTPRLMGVASADWGMDDADRARAYYAALDGGDYDALADLLAPDFVHRRPDRTIEGREAFVRFMREDRPEADTSHGFEAVYEGPDGVAVRGTLRHGDGSLWVRFVDVFEVGEDDIASLTTYTADPG